MGFRSLTRGFRRAIQNQLRSRRGQRKCDLRNRRPQLRLESLDPRLLLNADQNPYQSIDVNGDLYVSAIDALIVINRVNSGDPSSDPSKFEDVNGDSTFSAVDALLVINHLNNPKPLLTARLANDTGPVDQSNYDLLTNDYRLELVRHNGANDVFIRINGTGADPFVEISDYFATSSTELSEQAIDEIAGSALPDGTHRFELKIGDEETTLDFEVQVDQTPPVLNTPVKSNVTNGVHHFDLAFSETIADQLYAPKIFDRAFELPLEEVSGVGNELRLGSTLRPDTQAVSLLLQNGVFDLAGNATSESDVVVRNVQGPIDPPEFNYSSDSIFARFEGIAGDATDAKYSDWFEVYSAGHSSLSRDGLTQFEDLQLVMPHSLTSLGLTQLVAQGKLLGSLEVVFVSSQSERHEYLKYELKNVRLTSSEIVERSFDSPLHIVHVSFEQIDVESTERLPDGGLGATTQFSWKADKGRTSIPHHASRLQFNESESGYIFADVEGVEGSTSMGDFQKQLQVVSVDMALQTQPVDGKLVPQFEDVRIVAAYDKSSSEMARKLLDDKLIDNIALRYARMIETADGEGLTKFQEIVLKDVRLTSHELSIGADGFLYQVFTLQYGSATAEYLQFNPRTGKEDGAKNFEWTRGENAISVPYAENVPTEFNSSSSYVFARFQDFDGDSLDDKYAKWFDVYSVGHALLSRDGGAHFEDLQLVLPHTQSSLELAQALVREKNLGRLEVAFAGATSERPEFLKYDLSNVRVTSSEIVEHYSGSPVHIVNVSFDQIEIKKTEINDDGQLGQSSIYTWEADKGETSIPRQSGYLEFEGSSSYYMFADISGVEGSSAMPGFEKQLDVYSVDMALHTETNGGETQPLFEDVRIVASNDKSSPGLAKTLLDEEQIPDLTLRYAQMVTEKGEEKLKTFQEIKLSNVNVTSHETAIGADGLLYQVFTLRYDSATAKYSELNLDTGNVVSTQEFSWVRDKAATGYSPSGVPDLNFSYHSIFAKFSGIDGDTTDANYQNWFDVYSADHAVVGSEGKTHFEDLQLVLPYTQSSLKFLESVSNQKVIGDVEVAFVSHHLERHEYRKIDLFNARVTSSDIVEQQFGAPLFIITVGFDEISVKSSEIGPDGKLGETSTYSWQADKGESSIPHEPGVVSVDRDNPFYIFADIDGIDGSVSRDGFKSQVEILSVDMSVQAQQVSQQWLPDFTDVKIVAAFDRSSPALAKSLLDGKEVASLTLSYVQMFEQDGKESLETFQEFSMRDVRLKSHEVAVGPDGALYQVFTIDYQIMSAKYSTLDPRTGSVLEQKNYSWIRD